MKKLLIAVLALVLVVSFSLVTAVPAGAFPWDAELRAEITSPEEGQWIVVGSTFTVEVTIYNDGTDNAEVVDVDCVLFSGLSFATGETRHKNPPPSTGPYPYEPIEPGSSMDFSWQVVCTSPGDTTIRINPSSIGHIGESDIVNIRQVEGPITSNVVANPNPVAVNTAITLTATVDDSTTGGSNIASAEYIWDGGTVWYPMDAQDGAFDAVSEDVTASFSVGTAGVYDVCVSASDTANNVGVEECILLVVYDPTGGFVTGGGWINSPEDAYTAAPSLTGKATFGFVSKYKKGATVPTGQTEFQFKVADLNFHSSSYDWLVVTGSDYAKFKGTGTINGEGDYKFQLWAGDDDQDTFRIKIWYEVDDAELVVYENGMNQPIGGGSIVVHKKK